jgi:hypothetical protein
MQNMGSWNPSGQEWIESIPPHLCTLTATYEYSSPQPANATSKDAQLCRVARNSMVLVVAQHNLAEPCTNLGRAMMLPTLKLRLDGFELRGHPPLRRNPPDDESCVTVALPAVVSETQKHKGLRFSLTALFPVPGGEPPKLDQSCLVRM